MSSKAMSAKVHVAVLAIGLLSMSVWAAERKNVLTDEVIQKITAAAPEKATAQPQKARKILVYGKTTGGFYHDVIPIGAKAMEILGKKAGAWETVISDDPSNFEPEKLAQFDAVVMMSTTGEAFEVSRDDARKLTGQAKETNDRLRKSLLDFVKSGKGIIGSHAATDYSYDWPEYGEMMGGYFQGHPFYDIAVKIDDPKSPINAAFKGQGFTITDEMYTFRDPYSREKLHILLSIDLPNSVKIPADANRPGFKKGENRNDHDYAISWIREYGKGRVFYCSFGHQHQILWNPAILQHYLDGIQYALGDLKADATPTDKAGAAADGLKPLFNGKDLSGWKAKPDGWFVEDGVLAWKKGSGDVWTEEKYGDFVLDMEFKVAKGTNSGIFIRTGDTKDNVQTGIEIQVLDSAGQRPSKNSCGAVYDCLAPGKSAEKPAGEWNRIVITAKSNKLQMVMNDQQIVDMDLDQWSEAGKNPDGSNNKFKKAIKDFPREGYIGLQDHGGACWYRNIKLRKLAD